MSNHITWTSSKKRLALLWFFGSFFLFIIMIGQSIWGQYEDASQQAWQWFLPSIIPSLSLIIGAYAMDSISGTDKTKSVNKFFFNLTYTLSLIYLLLIAVSIFAEPLTPLGPIELLELSNLWLGPCQGLVSAALGAFFIKSQKASAQQS